MKTPSAIRRSTRFLMAAACGVSLAHATGDQPANKLPTPAAPKHLAADAPAPWMDWAKWVNARHPVADKEGHGPDIGSDLCPDRCGHSGKLATFAIVKYLRYEKPGEFGDPRQEQFLVLIEDNMTVRIRAVPPSRIW